MNPTFRSLLFWIIIFGLVMLLWQAIQGGQTSQEELSINTILEAIDDGRVAEVTLTGEAGNGEMTGKFKKGQEPVDGRQEFEMGYPDIPGLDLYQHLKEAGVEVYTKTAGENPILVIFLTWGPIIVIVALWIFFMRQFQSGGNKAMSFGKSKAKLLSSGGKKVTFEDVAGCDEAKAELCEVVDFLKEPQKFQRLGGKIPKGVLLMGSPGTGKTLLARAIAGQANVPFFSISGSDFVEMFVGVGASRVRDLFEQGKKNAPCIVFIDEIDAVGRHRGAGLGGGHDEREQTLNQLLVEMDGFETNEGVILIAATNRPDVLDPALLRPGRFDRQVVVDLPDLNGRTGILRVHTKNLPLSEDVDLSVVARGTPGFAGADLANLVNEAALMAARRDKKKVEAEDFEYAKDKIVMGLERRSLMLTDEEKLVTAYHEAGHAVVAAFLKSTDPVHKVTIIPRGRALGLTVQLPTEDRYTYKKTFIENRIAVLMGGRVAEELTQDDVTTGAGNDIVRATKMARQMVTEWGMSELGPLSMGGREEPVFLGREFHQKTDYGGQVANQIDEEVARIVNVGYETAKQILIERRNVLERLAQDLLERESVEGREVYEMIEELTGQDLLPESMRPSKDDGPPPGPPVTGTPVETSEDEKDPGLAGGGLPSPATT